MPAAPLRSAALVLPLGLLVAASWSAGGCGSGGAGGSGGSSSSTANGGGGTGGQATGGGGAASSSSSSASSSSSSTSSSSSSTSSASSSGTVWPDCKSCLDNTCQTEFDDCKAPASKCLDLQACIDTVCGNLMANGPTSEESQCFVYCQSLFSTVTKTQHLALVNCAQTGSCIPPCFGAPSDFEQCLYDATLGTCQSEDEACNTSPQCVSYRACVATCTSYAACLACGNTADGTVGRPIYEAYWKCVGTQCIAEEWLPNF